ncbi:Oidioi.mRNA.OKI2018_I69.YSR.g17106.t1.cds [Oikopleura dioica]|uniref:Oidioi.mRNA.OKI2018_I69.YSR.g17106.t1.cds n=1 Tax=Oikopleura dioica TaxID=34765 RepID=A0ABN7SI74_OIKDI|nr:Oidioi.mRNA.OKI2018_I69.YSR.g17106.t1.cds [Oikopleura dioica]
MGIIKTTSEAGAYEFTTLTCIEYKDANIQLLDLPGITEGAAPGKVHKAEIQIPKLTLELEAVGIRLNQGPPDIYFKQKMLVKKISETESDFSEELELELTAEELEEAKQHLLEKKKDQNEKKTTGDIVIDLESKSKKYLPPEEFGIELINPGLLARCMKPPANSSSSSCWEG